MQIYLELTVPSPEEKVFRKVFAVTALQNTLRLITFIFFPINVSLLVTATFYAE